MKKLICTLPLIFIPFLLNGQNTDKFTGSLLWKISGNGLEKSSYIFGTHHLADVSFAQTYPGFAQALESAPLVVGEIPMSEMAAVQSTMMLHAAMPAGTTYESLLPPEECLLLDESLRKHLGAGLSQFEKFKPSMISYILSIKLITETMPELNLLAHVSIDQYVQDEAKEKGKKVMGLETAEDQMRALFYADPLEVQARSLLCALSGMEHGRESFVRLNEFYAEGNLYKAYELAFEDPANPCPMSEESAAAINRNRNDQWVEQLPGLFADGPAFVAVGMLHLCGQEGLLYRLDQLGYTVEAVKD